MYYVRSYALVFVYVTFMPIYGRVTQDAQTDERLGEEEENEKVERVYVCVYVIFVCVYVNARKERYKMKGLEYGSKKKKNVKDRGRMRKSKYNIRQGQMVGWFRK